MTPVSVLFTWLNGLLSVAILGGGAWLSYEWSRRAYVYRIDLGRYVFDPDLGWNGQTGLLASAVALLAWALLGGVLVRAVLGWSRGGGARAAGGVPEFFQEAPNPAATHRLARPDGSELHVALHGPEDAPPIVLTHGWGANADEWNDLLRRLSDRFRLIVWDLPGLGRSTQPADRDFSLENMARDLDAVVGLAPGRPAVLVGHSIGGMITLTYCRLFPEALGTRVSGLALVHTTYTDPVKTHSLAPIAIPLEGPVLVPLSHLMIWLSPVVWVMNLLSYLNGTQHLSTKQTGFAGTESPEQVRFCTRFVLQAWPAVVARGLLGMMRYDATGTLPAISVPTLIVPGDRDGTCTPEASDRMHRDIPGSELVPLAPAKHMGLIEHNRRFADLVGAFAARVAPAGLAR